MSLPRLLLVVLLPLGAAVSVPPPAPEPASKIVVPMVVVANFENGQDSGDKPGEYQFRVEREHLDERIAVRGAERGIRRNAQGLYGLLLSDLSAFVLDPRLDLSHT